LGLPLFGVSPRYDGDLARAAESHGFESAWMPEHLVLPAEIPPTYLYSESGYPPIAPETPTVDGIMDWTKRFADEVISSV
jgi:alkanesulfonate monooxygenase SsuD/methylene tetrahydromethanopterin reductase-like flavin-dependent oxidoreductase (luciferase family)